MMSDEYEYWAMGAEGWFEAMMRDDVYGLFNRERIVASDAGLTSMLNVGYGNGAWRYITTCKICQKYWPNSQKTYLAQLPKYPYVTRDLNASGCWPA